MPRQNAIARRQSDALRLEVLKRYFDFSQGRPTAASIAREMDMSQDTVESWLSDPSNARFLDEVVPLWPNVGRAREAASRHAEQMLQVCIDLANGKLEKARAADRLKAAQFVLGIAGVRPTDQEVLLEEPPERRIQPILFNVQIGAPEPPSDVVDGESQLIADDE